MAKLSFESLPDAILTRIFLYHVGGHPHPTFAVRLAILLLNRRLSEVAQLACDQVIGLNASTQASDYWASAAVIPERRVRCRHLIWRSANEAHGRDEVMLCYIFGLTNLVRLELSIRITNARVRKAFLNHLPSFRPLFTSSYISIMSRWPVLPTSFEQPFLQSYCAYHCAPKSSLYVALPFSTQIVSSPLR